MKWRRFGVVFTITCALATTARADPMACAQDSVSVRGDWGQIRFSVELADNEAERAQGLMNRSNLPKRSGMLFVYDTPRQVAFWMKNTLIPLDLLFTDERGKVTKIHKMAIPGDLTPIPGGDSVYAVLEINGGLAERYGISVGSELRHKIFPSEIAIWPC